MRLLFAGAHWFAGAATVGIILVAVGAAMLLLVLMMVVGLIAGASHR